MGSRLQPTIYSDPPGFARLWLRITWLVLLLSVLVWSWLKLTAPSTLPIRRVKITGVYQHIDRQALQNTVVPLLNQGFFGIDVSAIQERLQQLAWVNQVDIKRVWPDSLVIHVTEQKALARWNDGALLNPQGDVFTPGKYSVDPALPHLWGPVHQQGLALQTYLQLRNVLQPLGVDIRELELTPRQAWRLVLNNSMTVLLGQEQMQERLLRFVKIYPRVVGDHAADIAYVDLRYPHGMAVNWKTNPSGI